MITATGAQRFTTVAILALAAGSAAAVEGSTAGQRTMELVEVVEKSRPAPISQDDYFASVAADLNATLNEERRRTLVASVETTYQLLAAELELSSGTRVAVNDAGDDDSSDVSVRRSNGT